MTTALLRLTWKEYRANRAFWVGLVVLAGLVQLALATLVSSADTRTSLIFMFALGAPAFFAVGSAGTTFAMEREERTLEFLRAIPARARQVFVSKLAVAGIATVAMYLALWPIAVYFNGGRLPAAKDLNEWMALWLVAGLEAIAWGAFFSLLSDRPMLAICEAIFVVSLTVNLLVPNPYRGVSPFCDVVPARLAIVLVVLMVDAALVKRWFHQDAILQWRKALALRRKQSAAAFSVDSAANEAALDKLLARPGRGAMFGHLIWQQWRQSGWAMFLLAGLTITLVEAIGWNFEWNWKHIHNILAWNVIGAIALLGCFVFRADQARQQFRFFVEHNVPPRYVWLSRQVPWLVAFSIAVFVIVIDRFGTQNLDAVLNTFSATSDWQRNYAISRFDPGVASEILALFTFAAICYAAGQWASMMIRSAPVSAVAGVTLGVVLCGWEEVMRQMDMNYWITVASIPLVLLFATWLRAPDWIRENRSLGARVRAALVLIVPATAMLVWVRIERVRQVPLVSPGFNVDARYSEFVEKPSAAAELLRQASDAVVDQQPLAYAGLPGPNALPEGELTDREWHERNAKALQLLTAAVRERGTPFPSPLSADDPTPYGPTRLVYLAVKDGQYLQNEGKLDAAFDRYFVALELACKTDVIRYSIGNSETGDYVCSRIVEWGAQKGQTVARLKAAIARLRGLSPDALPLEAKIEWLYLFARNRLLHGDGVLWVRQSEDGKKEVEADIEWAKFMPWERERAVRVVNLMTAASLERLQEFRRQLAEGEAIDTRPEMWAESNVENQYFFLSEYERAYGVELATAEKKAEWLKTTHPTDLRRIGEIGMNAASTLVRYEVWRRSTMILLALEAYRLEHGKLPDKLGDLKPAYFDKLPLDPYAGKPFYYFPSGISAEKLSNVARDDRSYVAQVSPGTPGIWSLGPDLEMGNRTVEGAFPLPEFRNFEDFRWNSATVWQRGLWFPIPEQKH